MESEVLGETVFDMLDTWFLKALHDDRGGGHRLVMESSPHWDDVADFRQDGKSATDRMKVWGRWR